MKTTPDGAHHHRSHPIRNTFFTGLFFLVPLGITYWVLDFLVRTTYRLMGPAVFKVLALFMNHVPLALVYFLSVLLVLGAVFLIGWLTSFYLGKKILSLVDLAMLRLPFVRTIYGGTKQIIEAFSLQKAGGSFKKVVMLEYPRRESWVMGFVTNESLEQAQTLFGRPVIGVFVPSTPNPTTGFLLYYNPFDMLLLDIEVEEAVKLIVSAGLVVPDHLLKKPPITLGESLGLNQSDYPITGMKS